MNCPSCGKEFEPVTNQTRCRPCSNLAFFWRMWVSTRVTKAVRNGDLPPVKTLECIDCGGKATGYDHRDYANPLDVEPVCHQCNTRRGPAKFPLKIPDVKFRLPPNKDVMAEIMEMLQAQETRQ